VSNAFFGHSTGGVAPADGPVRAMSDNGSYIFFDSADPLVPGADNRTLDVFEWEAQGTGGCALAQGCVHLIGSGEDRAPSYFLGASPDGHNVFFGTHARLVPQDTDTAGDLYDARICEPQNGNPCIQPASGRTGQCAGAACQNQPPLPLAQAPATLTLASSGNLAPVPSTTTTAKKATKKKAAKCSKPKKRSHGKCVARKKSKKTKAKKATSHKGGK
jgi:hypothetical protein